MATENFIVLFEKAFKNINKPCHRIFIFYLALFFYWKQRVFMNCRPSWINPSLINFGYYDVRCEVCWIKLLLNCQVRIISCAKCSYSFTNVEIVTENGFLDYYENKASYEKPVKDFRSNLSVFLDKTLKKFVAIVLREI